MPALFRVKKLTRYIIAYAYHEIFSLAQTVFVCSRPVPSFAGVLTGG